MSLLDQLRLLDRALRDVRVREALRTGDRGGRRLARFAGSVAPADLAVLRAVDARRFEAVAQRQAEMIRDRWWTPRFPGILAGTARALQGTTRDVALGVLASASYDKREGEDETGVALIGYVLGREDRTEDPAWLQDLIAYEYLVAVGLPRRSRSEKLDLALENRLLPEGTRFLEPLAKKPKLKATEISLARRVIALPLEFPASDLRDSLRTNQEVPDDIEPEPHVVIFVLDPEGATELRVPAVGHDVLDMVMAAPIEGTSLLEAFGADDREAAHTAVRVLIEAGVLAGSVPELVLPPPEEKTARGRGGKKKAGEAEPQGKPAKGKKGASAKTASTTAPARGASLKAASLKSAKPASPKAGTTKPAPAPAKKPAAKKPAPAKKPAAKAPAGTSKPKKHVAVSAGARKNPPGPARRR